MAATGVDRVVVATDDTRIKTAAEGFGAEVIMTSSQCQNGTERCAEAYENIGQHYDIIANLQGDAPLTPPWFIADLVRGLHQDPSAMIATPILRCDGRHLAALQNDRANGRVGGTTAVRDANGHGLYFSKEVIPHCTDAFASDAPTPVFHHVGVYAYRPAALCAYPTWEIGPLERLEGLEQLRFLEHGRAVLCVEVSAQGRAFWELNNPEDVARLERMMAEMGHV